jgi:hypothetical protein
MRFPRRAEGLLDSHVQLLGSRAKPATVRIRKRFRPREFLEAQQIAVEGARFWLGAAGTNDLDVIDPENPHTGVSTVDGLL